MARKEGGNGGVWARSLCLHAPVLFMCVSLSLCLSVSLCVCQCNCMSVFLRSGTTSPSPLSRCIIAITRIMAARKEGGVRVVGLLTGHLKLEDMCKDADIRH